MRSDYFAQMAALPLLRDECSGDGLYHLLPPRPEEIDQMIRLPAEAAGISFEVDARSGIGLDQELRTAASPNPYSLPLLEFTLDELYRRDILTRGGNTLRIATYRDELKKLEGAIAARAEAVCNTLPQNVREGALPEDFACARCGRRRRQANCPFASDVGSGNHARPADRAESADRSPAARSFTARTKCRRSGSRMKPSSPNGRSIATS